MSRGGAELFEVLRKRSEERRKKEERGGLLGWLGIAGKRPAPDAGGDADGPGILSQIERGGERIFKETLIPPAPVPIPPKTAPEEPAPGTAPAPAAEAAPAEMRRAQDIQLTLRAQNLVVLSLVFVAMFMLAFKMGSLAGKPRPPEEGYAASAPGSEDAGDSIPLDRIPPVSMSGGIRPAADPIPTEPPSAPPAAPGSKAPPAPSLKTLQIATFRPAERERAERLAKRLGERGISHVNLFTVGAPGSESIVLCAGAFASRTAPEAKKFQRTVEALKEGGRPLASSATLWRTLPQEFALVDR